MLFLLEGSRRFDDHVENFANETTEQTASIFCPIFNALQDTRILKTRDADIPQRKCIEE